MVYNIKLRKVGNSIGLVLPKEILAIMNAAEGDEIFLTEAPEGGFRLTPNQPDFGAKMEVASSLSRRYRNALSELAK